jgi:phosphate transport system protein
MRRFQQQLEDLQQRLLAMAALVKEAIDGSIRAVTERNRQAAEQVLRNEALVNQCEIEIDDQARAFSLSITRWLAIFGLS